MFFVVILGKVPRPLVHVGLALSQSCGLVILATSSVAVGTVLPNASNAMATQIVWTSQMRQHVVSV